MEGPDTPVVNVLLRLLRRGDGRERGPLASSTPSRCCSPADAGFQCLCRPFDLTTKPIPFSLQLRILVGKALLFLMLPQVPVGGFALPLFALGNSNVLLLEGPQIEGGVSPPLDWPR